MFWVHVLVAWQPSTRPCLLNFLSPLTTGTALGTELPTQIWWGQIIKIKTPIKMFNHIMGIPWPSQVDIKLPISLYNRKCFSDFYGKSTSSASHVILWSKVYLISFSYMFMILALLKNDHQSLRSPPPTDPVTKLCTGLTGKNMKQVSVYAAYYLVGTLSMTSYSL